jgi:hypothetical protein
MRRKPRAAQTLQVMNMTPVANRSPPDLYLVQEELHMRKLLVVFLLLGLTTAIVGCQASGKVDDDGVKAKVDTK